LMLYIPRQLCCDCCIDTMTRSGSVIVHAVFIISYTEVFLCSVFQHSVIRHSLVVLKAVKRDVELEGCVVNMISVICQLKTRLLNSHLCIFVSGRSKRHC